MSLRQRRQTDCQAFSRMRSDYQQNTLHKNKQIIKISFQNFLWNRFGLKCSPWKTNPLDSVPPLGLIWRIPFCLLLQYYCLSNFFLYMPSNKKYIYIFSLWFVCIYLYLYHFVKPSHKPSQTLHSLSLSINLSFALSTVLSIY